jgi:adenylate cyclase
MAGKYSPGQIETVTQQVDELAVSPTFVQAERLVKFLRFVIKNVLADHSDQLNQYAIAMEVYNRGETFDPATDSIVRVDAGRLRTKLREYYDTCGHSDQVRFELPKGTYVVRIHLGPSVKNNTPSIDQCAGNDNQKIAQNSTIGSMEIDKRPGKFSIAILPFEVISKNTEDHELADGITTEIIDELGRAATCEVVSRRSAFVYKGLNIDARKVAWELDVDYVLEGCLRHAGDRLRVTVALIDAQSGRQVWTELYDRTPGNFLELQDNIGHAITAALGGALRWAATERAQHIPAEHLDPIGLVHRATGMLFRYSHHTSEESEQLVRLALEQDADLAYGQTLLGFILALQIYQCWTDRVDEVRKEALAATNRALELDPVDSWVLSFTSGALLWLGEPMRAVTLMERALALDPENPLNRESMGHALIHVGRVEEGLAHLENAIDLSPGERLTPPLHVYRSYGYTQLCRYEDAEVAGRKGVEIMGAAPFSWIVYANALAENGKLLEAQNALAEVVRLSPRLTLGHLERVFRMAYEPDELAEHYLSGLRKLNWQLTGK